MRSEVEDLDALREHFRLESVALLRHSWGGLLALEYALRHPERGSGLVLMNPAPVSRADYLLLRQDRLQRAADDIEQLKARDTDAAYQAGDPDTVAAYYRIHFGRALRKPEHLEKVIQRLRSSFTREGILKARLIEERLMHETWLSSGYDLLPRLRQVSVPALVLHGDHDLIPADFAAHIAGAVPGARFIHLSDCGHFSFLECPEQVYYEIVEFFL